MAVAVLDRRARSRGRRRATCRTARARRRARRARCRRAARPRSRARISSQKYGAAAGVHDDRSGDEGDPAAVGLDARASSRRSRATPASTRRSDETSLVMNAKPWRSRSWNSGTTRMPSTPQTTASPLRTSRSLRHDGAAAVDRRSTASMRWSLDEQPLAARGARASGGWSSNRSRRARSRPGRRAASSRPACSRRGSRAARASRRPSGSAVVAVGRDAHREHRRLVVGAADREAAAPRTTALCRMTVSKMPLRMPESIRCPDASTTSEATRNHTFGPSYRTISSVMSSCGSSPSQNVRTSSSRCSRNLRRAGARRRGAARSTRAAADRRILRPWCSAPR